MLTFVKGTLLFTVILLIGSGWSFVKPFLSDREKKIIFVILALQVVNNIALTVLSNETEGEGSYERWTAIMHLVDIVCCCAVLIPIVWQVNALEKSVEVADDVEEQDEEEREMGLESGEKGEEILTKLKLFRSFYLLVVLYIYSTRILIYLFATMLNYKHLWVRYFVVEVVTLVFYVVVGFMFRPEANNPYLSVMKDEEADSLQQGLELKNLTGRKD
jgi:NADH:ubiquinone oxidoreductase subunit 3 (subunit A)